MLKHLTGRNQRPIALCVLILLEIFILIPVLSQEITGTVTDEKNAPLQGLNVIEKGTSNGTITDHNGRYTIVTDDPEAILQFSFIGYQTVDIPVAGQTVINIQMEPESQLLEDVVVIGYGAVKKEDLTGSVAVVTHEEITRTPIPNLSRAIQGKASGVVVYQDGAPGGGVNMRVRGIGSITNDPDPLFVVDGIIGADINAFSPEDIQSISVLKDASATAIYGANGANGVIVITTKRGTVSARPVVTFSASLGTNLMPKHFDLMNADQYAAFYNEAYELNNVTPHAAYSDHFREAYYDGDWHAGTDWQKEILQENLNQNYYVNISSGSENSNYSISANYFTEEGLLLKSASDRINLRANSDFSLGRYLKAGESLSITRKNSQNSSSSAWGMALESSPLMNVYNKDNKEGYEGSQIPVEYITEAGDTTYVNNTGGNDKFNPKGILAIPDRQSTYDNVIAEVYVEITPIKGLTFRSSPSVNAYVTENYNWEPAYDMGVRSVPTATLEHGNYRGHSLWWKNQLDFHRSFGRHNIAVTAVHQARKGFSRDIYGTAAGFPYEQLNVISQSLPDGRGVSGGEGTSADLSYLARLIYSYNSRYLITASVRRDGSSNFGPKRRWGTFPSFSAAWKINEDFLQQIEQINMLKLRVGWGMTGNSNIGGFRYQTLLASPDHFSPVFGEGQHKAYAINELWTSGNPLIKWEAAEMTNIGLDLNAFRNKIQFSAEYYIKKQSDLIMAVPISRIHWKGLSGATADPLVNIADIENRGFEFDLRYRKMEGSFTYTAFANLSTVKNEVIYVPSTLLSDNNITRIGNTIGSIYGFVAERIIQETDFDGEGNYLYAIPAEGVPSPGDLMYKDLNLDGVINDADRTIIGKAVPDLTYSFGVDCYYRGFDLSVFFYGIVNAQIYNTMRRDIECFESQDLDHNKSADWAANYYGKDGNPSTEYIRADVNNSNRNTRISTWWVDDASFLRLKDLQIGYSLPASVSNRIGISQARIYLSGMNLYTFTSYKGYDPESPLNSNDPRLPGVDSNAYPIPRTLTAGIQLTF
jgi:TonB-linked SusC/RagA family outer membrane protein